MNNLDLAMENLKNAMNGTGATSNRTYNLHRLNRANMSYSELQAHKESITLARLQYTNIRNK